MESENPTSAAEAHKPEPLLPNLAFNIALPVVILTQGDRVTDNAAIVLIVALFFPIGYFIQDYAKRRKVNFFSILGFVSVLLTGGVGLLELPRFWFIVKEAALPTIFGVVVLGSMITPWPLVKTLLYSKTVFDVKTIQDALAERNRTKAFESTLNKANLMLAASFFFSGILNFFVASHFVKTEPSIDPVKFNAEVGAMTGWSYLIIALPSMVIMMAIFYYLIRGIQRDTGMTLEECLAPHLREQEKEKTARQENT